MVFLVVSLSILYFLSACSAVPSRRVVGPAKSRVEHGAGPSKHEAYRVGELEVLVYRDREAMVQDLPDVPRLVDGLRFGDKQVKIYGYHDREKKRIYSIEDIPTLIHEFKHYLEPKWEHPPPDLPNVKAGGALDYPPVLKTPESPARQEPMPLPRLACMPVCLR